MEILSNQGFSDFDYAAFCQQIQKTYNMPLGDYKPDQMRRRIASMAEQARCASFLAYFGLMSKDVSVLSNFMDQVTINVTELVRNPKIFQDLMDSVLPKIAGYAGTGTFNVWSAGCSYGAEAYTMAMLLHEANPARPFKIKGTDVDLTILSKANQANFSTADMVNVSPERKKAYFGSMDGCTYIPSVKLRNNVSFSRHDLLADSYPREQYDLILCRNVLIYFTDPAKERIYEGFFQALKPGGVLFVGGTERLADHSKFGYEVLKPFFYMKPAERLAKAA